MHLSSLIVRLGVFILAAFASVIGARTAVAIVETRSVIAVQEDLIDNTYDWASVIGDGLQVILEGEAPSEAARFRAISTAGRIVDASRVIDNMSVAERGNIAPPEFAIEILRNDRGVSLIGLIPTDTDRDSLSARIARIADGQPVTDLLEVADYPVPETWNGALGYAMRALSELERSKISVTASRVSVNAIADSASEKRRLETSLARNAPDGVAMAVAITAPRPVISPYTTRFILDQDGARFEACAVDDASDQSTIMAAATEVGFEGKSSCVFALGQPSNTWADAVAMSIRAVGQLGAGSVTLSDTDITLVAAEGTSQSIFDRTVGELENALPDVFALSSELPALPDAEGDGPPQFTATLSPEGAVQLRGRVPDDLVNVTAENFAIAKFGERNVTMGTRTDDSLPGGWSVRVLTAIDALAELSNGAVIVEPDLVSVTGKTGNQNASTEITGLLLEKLGPQAKLDINVVYEEQLDPIAGLPTPEECVAQIDVVTEARKILFDPGSADITSETQTVVDDIAEILQRCPDLRIRIAGYTDSQGREEMNLALSQQRATAVLDALRLRRVPVATFEAIGFGEADPIADNDTEEGREANRRIEFSLIVPEATPDEPSTLEQLEAPAPDEASDG